MAQSIFESWKTRKEQNAIKFLLKHVEKEVVSVEKNLRDKLQIWRMHTYIHRLEAIIDEQNTLLTKLQ